MSDIQSEIIGFTVIAIVVVMLAIMTKKMEDRIKEREGRK